MPRANTVTDRSVYSKKAAHAQPQLLPSRKPAARGHKINPISYLILILSYLEAITGEAKQAFIALGTMPPLCNHAPEDDSPAAPREEIELGGVLRP